MATDEELRRYFCGYIENKPHYKKMLTDGYYRVHYTGKEADSIISMAEAVAIQFILDHVEDNPPRLTKAPGPCEFCMQEPEIYYPDDPRYYIFTEVLYIRTKSGKRKPEEWANFEAFDSAGQTRWNGAPSQITNFFWSCVGRPIRLVDIKGEGGKGPKSDDESVWEEKFGGSEEEVIEEIVGRVMELHPPDVVAIGEIFEFINQQDWVTSIGLTGDPNTPSIQFGPHTELEKILPVPIQEILPGDFHALVIDPSARPISLMSEEELAGLHDTATRIFMGLQKRTDLWAWVLFPIQIIVALAMRGLPTLLEFPPLKSNIDVANELGALMKTKILPEFDRAIGRIEAIKVLPEEQRRLLLGEWVRTESGERYELPEVQPITKGFFWYLWKDLQFAAKSWGYYYDQANLEIIEKIYPGITGTLRDKITGRLKEEYWNAIPSSSLEGLYLVNRVIQTVPGRFQKTLPTDMESPSDYDFIRDVLEPTIGEYFLTEYYKRVVPPQERKIIIGHMPTSIQSMETAIDQGSPMHHQFVGLGGVETGYTPPTTTLAAGGDGVLASSVGGASRFSLPSLPSVSLPGLGAGPSALPSSVGFGGIAEAPNVPSVDLSYLGWDGAAMSSPKLGFTESAGRNLPSVSPIRDLSQTAMSREPSGPSLAPTQISKGPGGGASGGGGLDFATLLGGSRQSMMPSSQGFQKGGTAEAGQSLSRAEKLVDRLMQIPDMLAMAEPSPLGTMETPGMTSPEMLQQMRPQIVHRFEKGSVQIHTRKPSPEAIGKLVISALSKYSRQGTEEA